MYRIDILDEYKSEALEHANNWQGANNSYTGLNEYEERWYCGYLGEICFREFLKARGIKFEYKVKAKGENGGGADFLIFTKEGIVLEIEVKTACKDFHNKIMVPKVQFEKYRYDFYIGLKLVGGECEIWGYCYPEEFIEEMVKVPTMCLVLSNLKNIDGLLDQLN